MKSVSTLAAVVGALVVAGLAFAAPGDLDATFNGTGWTATAIRTIGSTQVGPPVDDRASALALQPNGSLVAGGYQTNGLDWDHGGIYANSSFALARFTAAGTLDLGFGVGGRVTTWFGPGNCLCPTAGGGIRALVLQPDGRIVAAGEYVDNNTGATRFALARYLPNGALDPNFGIGGKVTTAGVGGAAALVRLPLGKLVAAGGRGTNFTLVRYKPNGQLDRTFGIGGKVTTAGTGPAAALVRQPNGKLVAAGGVMLTRYQPGGALDPTFGSSGKVTMAGIVDVRAIALQPDGKLVVAGTSRGDLALARYLPNGSPDMTFGASGNVIASIGQHADSLAALIIQPTDGRIVGAGWTKQDSGWTVPNHNNDAAFYTEFAVARFVP